MSVTYDLKIPVCTCERCGHRWVPKSVLKEPAALPVRCGNPRCNTPYWNTPREKKSEPIAAPQQQPQILERVE